VYGSNDMRKVGLMLGTTGRTLIGRHAMDRHSAARLRGDLLSFRHKKTDSKVGFSIYFYKEEMVPVSGL